MLLSSRTRSRSASFNRTVARAVAGALEPLEGRLLFCGLELDGLSTAPAATPGAATTSSSDIWQAANKMGFDAAADHHDGPLGTFGGINDADAIAATLAATATSTGGAVAAGIPLSSVPALSSRPGATAKLYLNFTGASAQSWGSYSVPATPAYDQDGDASTFSSGELSSINEIWQRVSEKYSPFNVDVTTVDPGNLSNLKTLQAVVGGNGAWLGSQAGGVAYVDGFTNSAPNTVWVFPVNLSNGYAKYVAEGIGHEAGHGFGLQHQSQYSGTTKTAEYFPGTGASAPIMGNSYSATRGLWWYGQTTSSATYQDDVAVISKSANQFGYRADDHSSSVSAPEALTLSGTSVSGSGIIEKLSDSDVFSFTTGAGAISINVTPVLGGMLDAKVQLFDASNSLISTFDSGLSESIATTLPAGTYKLAVSSHGATGDLGQYTISGTIQPASQVVTVAAPSSLSAAAASSAQVNLSWADNSGNETGFAIERSTDGVNWTQVGTVGAGVTTFSNTGLSGSTTYAFRVIAYAGSTYSGYSNTATATTPSAVTVPAGPSGLVSSPASSSQVYLAWTDNAVNETGYTVQRWTGAYWAVIANIAGNSTSYTAGGLASSTLYGFRVVATNSAGDSAPAETWVTTLSNVVIPAAPSGLAASGSAGSATLTWADNASDEAGFKIERSTDGVNFAQVGSVGANITTFADATVSPNTSYIYRVAAYNAAGNSAYSATASVNIPGYSVIVDNNTAGAVTGTGSWYRTSSNNGYYGSDYFHDGNTNKGGSSIVFTPTLANSGTYQVYMRWSAAGNRASSVPVDVSFAGGTSTVSVNQKTNGGKWVLLGTFNFSAGQLGSVRIRNSGTNGYVVADAIQFVQTAASSTTTGTTSTKVKQTKGTGPVAALATSTASSTPAPVFSAQLLSSGGQLGGSAADDLVHGKKVTGAFAALAMING